MRPLEARDAAEWASLRRQALEGEPLAFGATVPDDPNALVALFLERVGIAENSALFGAFVGGAMAGCVGLRRNPGAKERHAAMIWGMYVVPGARRCGAGSLLLQAAIAQARAWTGVEQVHLAVSDAAAHARHLYDRAGFLPWGRQPRALCWKGQFTDETHMMLDLGAPRPPATGRAADNRIN